MKTIPPPCPEPEIGPKYWRSLDQLADTPEFRQWLEREFQDGASELTDPVTRRHFVKIMSASFLLGGLGLTGCRRPQEHILPFSKQPEGYIHGVAQYYATARPSRGSVIPLLVKSNDGRPTKIEGNPEFKPSGGGTDVFSQASILDLYDPDRSMRFARAGNSVSSEEAFTFLRQFAATLGQNGGQGVGFLLDRTSSPTRLRIEGLLRQKYPNSRWYVDEAVDFDISRQAATAAFGASVKPLYQFDKAKRILSLDCDFLGNDENSHLNLRGYSAGRRVTPQSQDMNRLYVIESLMTITGGAADHRLAIPASQVAAAAARIATSLGQGNVPAEVQQLAGTFKGDEKWVTECARDLAQNGRQSLVVAGYQQPLVVHLIANVINAALGAIGNTVTLIPVPEQRYGRLTDLVRESAQLQTLVIVGGNHAYTAANDLDLKKFQNVLRLSYYEDETFANSTWHFPQAHYLESWGDGRAADGTYTAIQPLIEPIFGGITDLEFLARIAGLPSVRAYDLVRETFQAMAGNQNSENLWKKFLHDGLIAGSSPEPVNGSLNAGAISEAFRNFRPLPAPSPQGLEVIFHRDYKVDDGRYNNNGWLQEAPEPITKVVWENVIMVSPATATALGLKLAEKRKPEDFKNNDRGTIKGNDIVEVTLNGKTVRGPVWIQPGQSDHTVALALGYGRTKTGRVGTGAGYNAYLLRTVENPYMAAGGKVTRTGGMVRVTSTQEHGSLEGRPHIREANLEQYKGRPDFAKNMGLEAHAPNAGPIYKHPYRSTPETASKVHQWGMAIDLNGCVGCNACVIACQSENNVPIVGKDQVERGREMHWLRIDRYYAGDVNRPQMSTQPMLCQHCESAPCESVCPVNATVHDSEGLNVMAYNRCVGTRYCSNNCPWKVRRFNFFDYNKRPNDHAKVIGTMGGSLYKGPLAKKEPLEYDLIKMAKNPDVTVRMRGVMEKCTFCTQRIEAAKITQKVKAGASGNVEVPDGTITPACAQACPAEAIVFGNILDPNSRVSKMKNEERNYAVLGFLDTKPRLTYLARIRNPNKAMPDYTEAPLTLKEYSDAQHDDPFKKHGTHGKETAPGGGNAKVGEVKGGKH